MRCIRLINVGKETENKRIMVVKEKPVVARAKALCC